LELALSVYCMCILLCGSRKYPYPHRRGSLEIPRGRGVLKAKIFRENMSLNWNFQRGLVFKPKKPYVGGVSIFSGTTHYSLVPNP